MTSRLDTVCTSHGKPMNLDEKDGLQ